MSEHDGTREAVRADILRAFGPAVTEETRACVNCGQPVDPHAPQMDASDPLCPACQDAESGCCPCGCEPHGHACGIP